jgi:AcrR family transcriptional regulator
MAKTTKSAPLRGPRKAGPEATRQKILDAAEILFAERGFHSVSVRDITAAAGVDVALVHYHFGNKQLLFETVFMRRAELLNAERLRRRGHQRSRRSSTPSPTPCWTAPLVEARGGRRILP